MFLCLTMLVNDIILLFISLKDSETEVFICFEHIVEIMGIIHFIL